MNARRISSALLAITAAAVVLTGCEPVATDAAGSGTTPSASGPNCDPNGFGPLSGCDSTPAPAADTKTADPGTSISACDPAWVQRAAEYDRAHKQPGETWAVSDGCGNHAASDPQTDADSQAFDRKFNAALKAGPPPFDGTVVAVTKTGLVECLVDVEGTGASAGQHSRFPTDTCPKVGSPYPSKGGW